MLFLLDTSVFSELMRAEPDMVDWLASLSDEDRVVICPVVHGEVQFGISRLDEGKRSAVLEAVARQLSASVASLRQRS